MCEMRGAEVVPVTASEWQLSRRILPGAAIVGLDGPEKGYAVQRLVEIFAKLGWNQYAGIDR